MIQRIQTFFLALALLLMGLIIWLPLGEIAANGKIFSFTLMGIIDSQTGQSVSSAWYLMVLTGIVLFLQFVVIFSYKKRVRQARMAIINILLMLGILIGYWLFIMFAAKSMSDGIYTLKIPLIFPLIGIFLNYLAIRAIKRDEALVKSIERIR
jgi:hypothetical protein